MSGQQYQIRGDTRANIELATPAARELGVSTDKNELVIGDGATAGGLPVQRKNYAESLAPAQITSDQNNYSPASYDRHVGLLVLNTDAKRRLTGLAGGSTNRVLFVVNGGTQQLVLSDADAASTAANRFDLNGDLTLLPKGGVKLFYNATASRWQRTSGGAKFANVAEELLLSGVISPAQITSNQNDYAPTNVTLASVLRLSTDASRDLTGLVDPRDGAVKFINNVGAQALVLKNESASSTAANRFSFGADITLQPKQGAFIRYDVTDARWKLIAQTAGSAVGSGAVTAVTLAGSGIGHGPIVNGYLEWTVAGSALTVALKTLAGTDPSSSDPALVLVRNATAAPATGTPTYSLMTITAALSVVVSSGSSLGVAANNTAFRIWAELFNDAGTARIGVINCLSGANIFPLAGWGIASSTAEGGAGAADNAQTFYTGTAVAAKPYAILGYATWETGLAAVGTWSAGPTRMQVFGPGVPLPGDVLQELISASGAVATGTTTIPYDDTIPQNTEGDQYFSQAITTSSAANVLEVEAELYGTSSGTPIFVIVALFQDAVANALKAFANYAGTAGDGRGNSILHRMLAGAAATLKLRAGLHSAGTLTVNGSAGGRILGGVMASYLKVKEIMA